MATNILSGDYDFYDPLAQASNNINSNLDQGAAWTLPEPQPSSSSSTQPTSAHSRGQEPPSSHISKGAFRTRYCAFASLLPSFFALASTLAFFMPSVNILQDIEEDEDNSQDSKLGTGHITSLLGIGRLALQIIIECSSVKEQEGKLTFRYTSFLRLKYSPVNYVLDTYMSQILKWFLVDFYKFRQSVRRTTRDLVCEGYGFSATKSVADNIKLFTDIIHMAQYLHYFNTDGRVGFAIVI
jgi:hypothetical protein